MALCRILAGRRNRTCPDSCFTPAVDLAAATQPGPHLANAHHQPVCILRRPRLGRSRSVGKSDPLDHIRRHAHDGYNGLTAGRQFSGPRRGCCGLRRLCEQVAPPPNSFRQRRGTHNCNRHWRPGYQSGGRPRSSCCQVGQFAGHESSDLQSDIWYWKRLRAFANRLTAESDA